MAEARRWLNEVALVSISASLSDGFAAVSIYSIEMPLFLLSKQEFARRNQRKSRFIAGDESGWRFVLLSIELSFNRVEPSGWLMLAKKRK